MREWKLSCVKEFDNLGEGETIYKLMGPVLLKQDKVEAESTVKGRLDFINGEMYVGFATASGFVYMLTQKQIKIGGKDQGHSGQCGEEEDGDYPTAIFSAGWGSSASIIMRQNKASLEQPRKGFFQNNDYYALECQWRWAINHQPAVYTLYDISPIPQYPANCVTASSLAGL